MAFIVGITGGFGTGKTFVSRIFKKLGARIVDADKITHSLLFPGSPIYKKVVSKFGKCILNKNKSIDRKKLADIVFNSNKQLSAYLKIIHPMIMKIIRAKIKAISKISKKTKIIILDAPLLIEVGLHLSVDKLVVVKTNRKNQILRLQNKFGETKSNILKRIKFQSPLSKKIKMADYIVDNNGTRKQTEFQVRQIWNELNC